MQPVHIHCENNYRVVKQAEIVGPFAIHEGTDIYHDTYVVTHLFTGLRLFPRATSENFIYTMADAIDLAKRAWAVANWYFDQEMIVNNKPFREEVKQALKDANLY